MAGRAVEVEEILRRAGVGADELPAAARPDAITTSDGVGIDVGGVYLVDGDEVLNASLTRAQLLGFAALLLDAAEQCALAAAPQGSA